MKLYEQIGDKNIVILRSIINNKKRIVPERPKYYGRYDIYVGRKRIESGGLISYSLFGFIHNKHVKLNFKRESSIPEEIIKQAEQLYVLDSL